MTGNNSEGAPGSNTKATNAQQPGEGIRNLKTSNVFRAVNFELYAKPNKYMMTFGICAFSFCVGYMIYMKESWRKERVYTVINDKDELIMTKKRSRWD